MYIDSQEKKIDRRKALYELLQCKDTKVRILHYFYMPGKQQKL
jgi:hypothetical protein